MSRADIADPSLFPDPSTCNPAAVPSPHGGWDLELPLGTLAKPMNFREVFGREARTEVEIGSGTGMYLAVEAFRRPEVNFLGIEQDASCANRAKDKWRRRNLHNTRMVRCDALYFLEEFAAPGSIDAYIILYSDPWPKTKHHKRRLFQPRLVPILERTLRGGGPLLIKTDVTEYYTLIRALLDAAPFLELEFDHRLDLLSEPPPLDIETNFQGKARAAGHPLHWFQYRRR